MLPPPIDPAVLIRDVNESNEAVEDQCLRARQAADTAIRSAGAAEKAAAAAHRAAVAHQTIQAERPRRRAPLPRQMTCALLTVALDGVACYFAAQALDGSQDATLVWTGLFLAVLAGGELTLDFYRDRNLRMWRNLAALTGAFITLLGILRFWFLATIGTGGLVPSIAGAGLFTAATAGFLSLGYRALRAAETPQTWRARRQARKARQTAWSLRTMADGDAKERDRLIDAYLCHVRRVVFKTCSVEQQLAMEAAVRQHLSGRCSWHEAALSSTVSAVRVLRRPPSHRHRGLPAHAYERTAGRAHALPPGFTHIRAAHHHRPGFAIRDAGYGSARRTLGASGRTNRHTKRAKRSDPGLFAGSGLPRQACTCSARSARASFDQFPEGASDPGRPEVPGHAVCRPGSPAPARAGRNRGMG